MLNLKEITLRRGAKILLDQASMRLDIGYKAGLIGRNGAGKTSLFKLIIGELSEDHGSVFLPNNWQIAHLAQELPVTDDIAFAYVRSGDAPWVKLQKEIEQAEAADDGIKIAELYTEMEVIDGYRIDVRVSIILKGLGFSEDEMQQPVKSFSGGWQMRLQLARVLISQADFLLLDEPTNHLDFESIVWLTQWCRDYQGTMMVISHDRYFLDQVTTHTIQLAHKNLKLYQGNYSSFAEQLQTSLLLQEKIKEKTLKKKAHLQKFVDRFRAKASKAKQAQSRMKAIEKLQVTQNLQDEEDVSFQFFEPKPTGYPTITIRGDLGYENKVILNGVSLTVAEGDRIGVIGINGSGKSTLLKSIAHDIPMLQGDITYHPRTRIGYFSQQQVDMLHHDETPIDHLMQQDPTLSEGKARQFLGRFAFSNDRVFEPVSIFSGGEKARLALALLIWQKPNVLLLDEPTNHLDMQVRESLIIALEDFSGALLLVSHDRYFIECCVNNLWLVKDGTVTHYPDNLKDYENIQLANMPSKKKSIHKNKPEAIAHVDKETAKTIKQLEKEISTLQKKLQDFEKRLADPALYQPENKDKHIQLAKEEKTLQKTLEAKEKRWFELSE